MTTNPYATPETTNSAPGSMKSAWSRLITFLLVVGIALVLLALFLPGLRGGGAREAAMRTRCRNHLKHIALAINEYNDVYGSLPPAYTTNADGERLHSWRTLILPFMDQQKLYDGIDLARPWNDAVNQEAFAAYLPELECPSAELSAGFTTYLAVVGPDAFFRQDGVPRTISEFKDGTNMTLMVIEVSPDNAVHWMSPVDADEAMVVSLAENEQTAHRGGVQAVLVDGTTCFINASVPNETRAALISIAGDDQVGEF